MLLCILLVCLHRLYCLPFAPILWKALVLGIGFGPLFASVLASRMELPLGKIVRSTNWSYQTTSKLISKSKWGMSVNCYFHLVGGDCDLFWLEGIVYKNKSSFEEVPPSNSLGLKKFFHVVDRKRTL